ncbi:MAG: hypothetical protein A3I29_03350 [Candidatus Magasanikbacteria bacterium RIFCSPLOWO2_02_FULL_44_11]|uniref:Uncharacterized protein n=2 Tax=Candidatus Magasanikiibacteriota TaxID=1752731 RepID=A0A1F6NAF5_9BACT|nr:MAG: hypothetical protein A3D53_01860 [Candidatus Magasanikbacteria bacterium RIFCSPHIGHO2_02_FULL_45_10]OGH80905.1 MAG: hypothetical protein A3I29_03350 [Candidatus Magasanikbacteria bacterium RIFCSPLOWO2_02_FULL_44_11]
MKPLTSEKTIPLRNKEVVMGRSNVVQLKPGNEEMCMHGKCLNHQFDPEIVGTVLVPKPGIFGKETNWFTRFLGFFRKKTYWFTRCCNSPMAMYVERTTWCCLKCGRQYFRFFGSWEYCLCCGKSRYRKMYGGDDC